MTSSRPSHLLIRPGLIDNKTEKNGSDCRALLSCTDGYGPPHIKLLLEWKSAVYRRFEHYILIRYTHTSNGPFSGYPGEPVPER